MFVFPICAHNFFEIIPQFNFLELLLIGLFDYYSPTNLQLGITASVVHRVKEVET